MIIQYRVPADSGRRASYAEGGYMTVSSRCLVVLLWLASLLAVGTVVAAQTRREPAAVLSGDSIGFRPEGWNGKARTGTWMVRINGEWVEAQSVMKAVPATTR
jgi:hypothetical protein